MSVGTFDGVGVEEQLAALKARALDDRPALPTGFAGLDAQLHRGGLQPGQLVVLGGRMHTRKTAVALNLAVNFLRRGVPVGFVSLDESLPMYVNKLMSIVARLPSEVIEDNWDSPPVLRALTEYEELCRGKLYLTRGVRPNMDALNAWLKMADMDGQETPRVVIIDYVSLMVHYRGRENERVPRLFEELQTWTHDQDLITVALHQAGRTDEGVSKKYHGDTPMTSEGLMYGGEQQADIILSTYRPALNQLGSMGMATAQSILGDTFDEEKWSDARARVNKFQRSTFLQLLKNRPSTKGLNFEGTELVSPDESQYMEQQGDGVSASAEWKDEE
jgi:replicative DNA helicase